MEEIAIWGQSNGTHLTGNSGRYYVKNPFGEGKSYEYNMFPSKADYIKIVQGEPVSKEEMMKDMNTYPYYHFDVKTGEETKTYYTDTEGKLLDDPSTMEEMLEVLYQIHGRENVKFKFKKCITTSLSSLV
ncbi:hypothetical protein [Bernardetia sp.]|uniref:hypothetical protein n=1 Tax=Bernardetia sp. TaxID=1937974 RepID=UPI0025B995D7|nr:hypothetical protein [Bernardetia sp.]